MDAERLAFFDGSGWLCLLLNAKGDDDKRMAVFLFSGGNGMGLRIVEEACDCEMAQRLISSVPFICHYGLNV